MWVKMQQIYLIYNLLVYSKYLAGITVSYGKMLYRKLNKKWPEAATWMIQLPRLELRRMWNIQQPDSSSPHADHAVGRPTTVNITQHIKTSVAKSKQNNTTVPTAFFSNKLKHLEARN